MDQDNIKLQLQSWLQRKNPKGFARSLDDLPISIASDVGMVRTENQDRAVLLRAQVSSTKSFVVGVLCDGMGGMADGAECASLAISVFISSCIRNRALNVQDRLKNAVQEADRAVYKLYSGNGGATLSAFIFDSDGNASAINVGDSRIYCLFKNGKVEQLTVDDTIAGQLKQIDGSSPLNNKLLQFIGIGDDLEPHIIELPETSSIQKLLLTSDGVHYLPQNTFNSLLVQDISALELSKRLISVSKWCGGHDNATTIVISEPYSMFAQAGNAVTGTIRLYDYNGDVYLIGIEKNQPLEASGAQASSAFEKASSDSSVVEEKGQGTLQENISQGSESIEHQDSSDDVQENSEEKEDTSEQSKPARYKKRAVSNKNTKSKKPDNKKDSGDEKPQLRMDFDG